MGACHPSYPKGAKNELLTALNLRNDAVASLAVDRLEEDATRYFDRRHRSLLSLAILHHCPKTAEKIIEKIGSNTDYLKMVDDRGHSAIYYAGRELHLALLGKIEHLDGVDIDFFVDEVCHAVFRWYPHERDPVGPLLRRGIAEGQWNVDPNQVINTAIDIGDQEMIDLLIEHKPHTLVLNDSLLRRLDRIPIEMIQNLMNCRTVEVTSSSVEYAVYQAMLMGRLKLIDQLLERFRYSGRYQGVPILYFGCQKASEKALIRLIDAGVVDYVDHLDETNTDSFSHAISRGFTRVVPMLLKTGALHLGRSSDRFGTPMINACLHQQEEIALWLLDEPWKRLKLNSRDRFGHRAIDYARIHNLGEVIKKIQDRNPKMKDSAYAEF